MACRLGFGPGIEPVLKVVTHVVAAKRQHGEGVAAHHALRPKGGGGGFRPHGRGHVNALGPAAGFRDQWHGGGAAAAKHEGINRHACGVVPGRVKCRVVGCSHGKAGVGVGGFGAGFLGNLGGPVFALPVDQVIGQFAGVFFHAFPPHVAVIGQCDVGEDHILVQAQHAVGVGLHVGAGSHAKITSFRVDGVHLAVGVRLDPSDVVANGGDFPACKCRWWHQHREVGFAASAGESRCHMVFFALRVGHAQNQHVLGQPALAASRFAGRRTAHVGGNAQRKALFAQQGVATIARTIRPNFTRFREMHDVLGGWVAGPRCGVSLTGRQGRAHGVHARHKIALRAQHIEHGLAHAGHDFLVHRHVGAVGQLDADVADVRTQRPHRKRHHVHRAASHAAVKQRVQGGAHLRGFHPVVGGASVFFFG